MISAFWEMFKPLYAVDTLEGYTENEIAYLKELFGALPQVLEDYYRAAGRTVFRTHGYCQNISRSGNGCGNRNT